MIGNQQELFRQDADLRTDAAVICAALRALWPTHGVYSPLKISCPSARAEVANGVKAFQAALRAIQAEREKILRQIAATEFTAPEAAP